MIYKDDVLLLHQLSIEKYGGAFGLRDEQALESALARPFQTFDDKELYPSILEKAAAICESIILNHPFIDGNKRTAFLAMFMMLRQENFELIASEDEIYSVLISIAEGKKTFKEITEWLQNNSASLKK